jgi:ribosomal-protein-alanine N-acetyltransferase
MIDNRQKESHKRVSKIEIRKMRPEDVSRVLQIERELFTDAWPDEAFEVVRNPPGIKHYVVTVDSLIVGYAVTSRIEEEFQIANLAVASEYQKKGLGTKLMKFILGQAVKANCEYCYLEVRAGNTRAIEFYRKFGFKITGIQTNYYENPIEDAVIMTLTLYKNGLV